MRVSVFVFMFLFFITLRCGESLPLSYSLEQETTTEVDEKAATIGEIGNNDDRTVTLEDFPKVYIHLIYKENRHPAVKFEITKKDYVGFLSEFAILSVSFALMLLLLSAIHFKVKRTKVAPQNKKPAQMQTPTCA